jgi:hypothetical protein
MYRVAIICIVFLGYAVAFPLSPEAREDEQPDTAFSYTVRTLLFADTQSPAHSTQNPDNAFLNLYRSSGDLQVRPDFFVELPGMSAVAKPRFTSSYRWWEDGASKGESDSLNRVFLNEWRVQTKPFSALFLSFGKEKLLWGPSFLASPSNILFRDNEKVNPYAEVEGKYFAKMIALPSNALTVNLIVETQKDVNDLQEPVRPLQALKMDFMGSSYAFSVIGYHRPGDRFRLGSFGQWTASDALVLYYDGIVTKGTDALYPARDPANPLGGGFVKKYDDSNRLFTSSTVGGAYTFLSGGTFSLEFLYNGQGYNASEAGEYYTLRQSANDHFFDAGALSGLSRNTLNESLNNGLLFLRRYYLMGQFQLLEIKNMLDVTVRYVHGLEEHAGQASSIVEWRISNRFQLFNINTIAISNGKDTEFNAVIARSFMAGTEAHF